MITVIFCDGDDHDDDGDGEMVPLLISADAHCLRDGHDDVPVGLHNDVTKRSRNEQEDMHNENSKALVTRLLAKVPYCKTGNGLLQ